MTFNRIIYRVVFLFLFFVFEKRFEEHMRRHCLKFLDEIFFPPQVIRSEKCLAAPLSSKVSFL